MSPRVSAAPHRRIVAFMVAYGLLATSPLAWPATAAAPRPAAHAESAHATAHTTPLWDWPLPPTTPVLRPFDPPAQPWLPGHRGADLAAAVGTPVTSPADGTLTFARVVVDRPVVVITHADGHRSSLEPVTTDLAPGTAVSAGQTVGVVDVGNGHCGATSCLHWGVRRGNVYVDPLRRGVPQRVRLLPLTSR